MEDRHYYFCELHLPYMYKIAHYLCGSTCTNSSSRVYIAAGSKPRATTFTTGNILLQTKVTC